MTSKDIIAEKIVSLIKDYREEGLLPAGIDFNETSELYGRNGFVNSFNLVTLVVDLEEFVEDEFGKTVTIADEKVFSLKHSPFRTIVALAEYTAGLMEKA